MTWLLRLWNNRGVVLLVASLIGVGGLCYFVKGRIDRAAEADDLERSLKTERTLRATAEAANAKTSAELAKHDEQVRTVIKVVVRDVPRLIPDNRVCDISPEALKRINCARGYCDE